MSQNSINYKVWAIKQKMHELIKAIDRFPQSPFRQKREEELENLKKDLEDK